MTQQQVIEKGKQTYHILLYLLLAIKAVALVLYIFKGGLGLGPDEAQYWTWSRALDWGYYSKPPGIAWQIAGGTLLFGQTELGVRVGSILIGFLLPLLLYRGALASGLTEKTSFWVAIAFAFSPMGVMASLLAITDGGMILFWTAVCCYLCKKLSQEEAPNYLLVGLAIFFGALFKWPAYFLWVAILPGMIWIKPLRSWGIVLGVLLSLLALLPSVYWNAHHDWATFKHVEATLLGGNAAAAKGGWYHGNALDFIGSQAALVSPILFALMIAALTAALRNGKAPSAIRFCALLSAVALIGGIIVSFMMKMQGNWIIFAYPTAFIAAGWYCFQSKEKLAIWYQGGVALSLLLSAFVLSIPQMQANGKLLIPYKMSPFKHNVGWHHIPEVLRRAGYNPASDYLLSDKYQTASELSFYGPQQKRAHFLNLHGVRRNQFSYWPGVESEGKGTKGYFVAVENVPKLNDALTTLAADYEKHLKKFYDKVEVIGVFPLFSANGSVAKGALILECSGFKGKGMEREGFEPSIPF